MLEILQERAKIVTECRKHPELQTAYNELCRKDILYWFKNFLYTDKNKTIYGNDMPDILPFVPYEFQEEYILEVWESIVEWNKPVQERKEWVLTNIFIEKSRQMGISWLTAGIFLYGFLFHKHKYTIISRTAEEVDKSWDMDSMFEKIRFMIRHLPIWMLPKGFSKEQGRDKTNAYMNITDPEWVASITGKTANPDAGRWGTRNCIFMDEMASMQYAKEIKEAAGANTPCIIYNSTPNWEGNEFYRTRKLTMPHKNDNGDMVEPEVKWLRYHWSDHPLYTAERYKEKIKGKTPEEIAQEFEIDYNVAVEGRVYPEFNQDSMPVYYNPELPLYIALDNSHWWTDPNAIIVLQPENQYWNVIDCVEINTTPENCAEFMAGVPKFQMTITQEKFLNRYKTYHWQRAIFISDPYDTDVAMGNSTILIDYKKAGINLFRPECRDKTQHISKTRTNIYRVRYNDRCDSFASAIMNAKYPQRRENSNTTTENKRPVHDWTSHYRTALEYFVMYMIENPLADSKPQIAVDTRVKKDHLWRMIYPEWYKNSIL